MFARKAPRKARGAPASSPPNPEPSGWSFKDYKDGVAMLDQVKQDICTAAFDAAEIHLATARSQLGCDRLVLIASAEIAQAQGHWAEAESRWQRVIDAHPQVVIAHANRALAVQAQGDASRAAELYHRLIREFPNDVGAPIALVHLLGAIDEPQREKFAAIAESGLMHLIRLHPDYAVLLVARARLAKARNDWTAALADLARARELDKNDSKIWTEIREVIEVMESRKESCRSLFAPEGQQT